MKGLRMMKDDEQETKRSQIILIFVNITSNLNITKEDDKDDQEDDKDDRPKPKTMTK